MIVEIRTSQSPQLLYVVRFPQVFQIRVRRTRRKETPANIAVVSNICCHYLNSRLYGGIEMDSFPLEKGGNYRV